MAAVGAQNTAARGRERESKWGKEQEEAMALLVLALNIRGEVRREVGWWHAPRRRGLTRTGVGAGMGWDAEARATGTAKDDAFNAPARSRCVNGREEGELAKNARTRTRATRAVA